MVANLGPVLILIAMGFQGETTSWKGKAEAPIDGDILRIRDDKDRVHKVRIFGIDAPDEGQRFYAAARDHLGKVTKDREVEVTEIGTDSGGRTVARVRIGDQDVALDMLTAGLAWYHRSAIDDPALQIEERRAKGRNLGLWIDKDAKPPWEFRAALERRRKARRAAANPPAP